MLFLQRLSKYLLHQIWAKKYTSLILQGPVQPPVKCQLIYPNEDPNSMKQAQGWANFLLQNGFESGEIIMFTFHHVVFGKILHVVILFFLNMAMNYCFVSTFSSL